MSRARAKDGIARTATAMMRKARRLHQAELLEALASFLQIGDQMSNLCFNLGQHASVLRYGVLVANPNAPGRALDGRCQASMYACSKAWDALKAKYAPAIYRAAGQRRRRS